MTVTEAVTVIHSGLATQDTVLRKNGWENKPRLEANFLSNLRVSSSSFAAPQ
jgi:hypothetical protein